jgi:hypothetical protein
MNGSVRSETSDVTVDKEQYGSHYSAKIGNGGSPITISGINGNVRLTRTMVAATTTEKKTGEAKSETRSESKGGSKSSEK